MKGFKGFLMRGNLIELAVAFIIGGAFSKVVESFTKLIMDIIGLLGGKPDFSAVTVGSVNVGVFLTAVASFVFLASVVYFGVVKPYEKLYEMTNRKAKAEAAASEAAKAGTAGPTQEQLLTEIRDLLKTKG